MPKHAFSLAGNNAAGGPALTRAGLDAVRDLGGALRLRYYGAAGSCTGGCVGDGTFVPSAVLVSSTNLARTLGTAVTASAALFPASARALSPNGTAMPLPVYTEDEEVLRGYAHCPALHERIRAWHTSRPFEAKEEESASLRAAVGAAAGQPAPPLAEFWNAYDALTHNTTTAAAAWWKAADELAA